MILDYKLPPRRPGEFIFNFLIFNCFMKKVLFVLLGVLVAGIVSAEVKKIKGTGYLVVHDRPAEQPFTRVSVQQSITLYVGQGKTEGITVEADDNIAPYIKTEIKNGQLNVYLDPEVIIRGYTAMNVSVSVPVLAGVNVAAAGRLEGTSPFNVKKLDIVASGAGIVKLDVKGGEVDVEASGAARLELKGTADRLELDMSTASTLKAWELHVTDCEAEVSGAAKAEVNVSGKLEAEISSAGILIYDGNPRIDKRDVTGRGTLVKRR